MAVVYADAAGLILAVRRTQKEDDDEGAPPGTAQQVAFDERTNRALTRLLRTNRDEFSILAGVLRRNSLPVTINPPGPLALLRAKVFGSAPLDQADLHLLGRIVFKGLLDQHDD